VKQVKEELLITQLKKKYMALLQPVAKKKTEPKTPSDSVNDDW
jgi:hypothetical protein